MPADTDTAEIVNIAFRDLRWLTFALGVVYTRTDTESKIAKTLAKRFAKSIDDNPTMPTFALSFSRDEALLCLWAANEGRCRDGDEWLIRGRMQRTFTEYVGGKWGVNQNGS